MSKFRSALKQIILSILGMFLSPVVAFAIGLPVIGLLFGMLYGIEFFKLKSVARSWMYVFGSWAIISGIYWIGFTLTSDFVTLRTRREVVSYFIKQLLVVLFFVAFVAFFISSFISKDFWDNLITRDGFVKTMVIVLVPAIYGMYKGLKISMKEDQARQMAETTHN